MSKDVRAAGAYVELFTKDGLLARGLTAAQNRVKAFAKRAQADLRAWATSSTTAGVALQAMSAGITAPLLAATYAFAQAGDHLDKMSGRTGVSVDVLSGLGFAAEQTGSNIEVVEKMMKGLGRTTLAVKQGNKQLAQSLKDIGINAEEFVNLSPENQLKAISEGLRGVANDSMRAGYALQIVGRSGLELMPLMMTGAEGISALQKEAESLGFVMRPEDTKQAAELTDAMNRSRRAAGGLYTMIGAALAPSITGLFNAAAPLVAQTTQWVNANRPLIVQIFAIGAAIGAAGTLLVGAGAGLFALSTVIGSVVSLVGFASTAFAALASPVLIASVAAFGLFMLFRDYIPSTGALLGWLSGKWKMLADEGAETIGAIAAALQAGDLKAAADILWKQLQVIWIQGTQPLKNEWYLWKAAFLNTIGSATATAKSLWVEMTTGMLQTWNKAQALLLPLIGKAQDTLADYIAQAGEALGIFGEGTFETLQEDQAARAKQTAARVAALEDENRKLEADKQAKLAAIQAQADTDTESVNNYAAQQIAELEKRIENSQAQLVAARNSAKADAKQKAELENAGTKAVASFQGFARVAGSAKAVEVGTSEALSAILQATRKDPQERMLELMQKQTDIQDEQAADLFDINNNTANAQILKVESAD